LVRIERRPPRFFPVTEFIASAFIMALSPSARTRLKSCGAAPPTAPLVVPSQNVFVILIAV
jgi:hypothetical protein